MWEELSRAVFTLSSAVWKYIHKNTVKFVGICPFGSMFTFLFIKHWYKRKNSQNQYLTGLTGTTYTWSIGIGFVARLCCQEMAILEASSQVQGWAGAASRGWGAAKGGEWHFLFITSQTPSFCLHRRLTNTSFFNEDHLPST